MDIPYNAMTLDNMLHAIVTKDPSKKVIRPGRSFREKREPVDHLLDVLPRNFYPAGLYKLEE